MSQHDYQINNQGFPATRADLNNALSAIATNNSGTSAPSTQYAGQFWIDTTSSTWTMYIHDGTDDIQFATIDTSANTVNFIDSALAYPLTTFSSTGIDDNATSTAITIDSSERVGIGTTSPTQRLDVINSNSQIHFGSATTGGGYLMSTVDAQFRLSGGALFTGNWTAKSTEAAIIAHDGSTDGIKFFVNTSLTSGNTFTPTERMRIDGSGNIRINGAGVQDTSNPGWTFNYVGGNQQSELEHVSGNTGGLIARWRTTSGVAGSITTSGTSTTYATSSDYRVKENVNYDFDATTRLKQLKPARFNFISDTNKTVDGFLAHEVQSVVPEAIVGEKDAMTTEPYVITPAVLDEQGNVITEAVMGTREVPDLQGIDQSKLVPLLVKTIQELEARITALEN